MSETLAHLSVKEFADQLASKAPVPGGGAVAAVTAAHSAALGCMVLAYTLGKSNFAAHESENKIKLECLQRAQSQALALADQDAAAYATLSALWKLPPTDARRVAQEPAAVRAATAAPMAIVLLAGAILESLQNLHKTCNPNLISDLAIAAKLADTAADAAAWNVRVNVPQLETEAERAAAQTQLDRALASVRTTADSIANHIASKMKAK
jgi:formiminotetrahydrofolate cyclodeaminase